MALAYNRIDAEQDKMRNVLEAGEYLFHVKSITPKPCKNAVNNMLVVELSVGGNDGRIITVTDWVILDLESMAWKLRHFASTCNLLDRYDDGIIEANDFLGREGIAKLTIAEYEKDGEMVKVNRVKDYIVSSKKIASSNDDFIDDDIPL